MGNIENLISNMKEKGLEPNCEPILDGTIHRFSRNPQKPHEKDEWYVGFVMDSGHIHCTFGSWSTNQNFSQTYKSYGSDYQLTAEEIAQIKAVREKAEEERRQAKEKAKIVIQDKLEKAKQPSKSHLYISRKKIIPYGARQLKDHILLPMQNHFGDITGMEWINPEGVRRTIKGSQKKGSMLPLADMKSAMIIRLAEGWATACSIQEARPNDCAVCCFGLSNVREVAKILKAKYPKKQIVACIDAGVPEKELEALKVCGQVLTPKLAQNQLDAGLNDFNDLHVDIGIAEVKEQLKPGVLLPLSLEDYMSLEAEPIHWHSKAILLKGGLTVVHALPGVGKSYFCMELTHAIANASWFFTGNCNPASVLYVDGEMPRNQFQAMCNEISDRRQEATPPGSVSVLTMDIMRSLDLEALNLHFEDHRAKLDPIIEDHNVIVIDNWFNLADCPQSASFNDVDKHERKILAWMRAWQELGKSFVVVNHTSKSGSMYGFQALVKGATTVIRLEELPEKRDLSDGNGSDGFRIRYEKNRSISRREYWDVDAVKFGNMNSKTKWKVYTINEDS